MAGYAACYVRVGQAGQTAFRRPPGLMRTVLGNVVERRYGGVEVNHERADENGFQTQSPAGVTGRALCLN